LLRLFQLLFFHSFENKKRLTRYNLFLVSNADNTWEAGHDIHPDLIAEFERHQVDIDASNPIYTASGEDPPTKPRASLSSSTSSSNRTESPPAKKKKKTSNSVVLTTTPTTTVENELPKQTFGVEKGWRVRAVTGAAKQKDSSVLYAVDYVQGSPLLREYVPSEIAHSYIPRELIEFFQKKIVWNSPDPNKKI
jgi:hypothetical protein